MVNGQLDINYPANSGKGNRKASWISQKHLTELLRFRNIVPGIRAIIIKELNKNNSTFIRAENQTEIRQRESPSPTFFNYDNNDKCDYKRCSNNIMAKQNRKNDYYKYFKIPQWSSTNLLSTAITIGEHPKQVKHLNYLGIYMTSSRNLKEEVQKKLQWYMEACVTIWRNKHMSGKSPTHEAPKTNLNKPEIYYWLHT